MSSRESGASASSGLARRWLERVFRLHHDHIHVPRVERVAQVMAEHIGEAHTLLDVGCGSGDVALRIASLLGVPRVMGVDVKVRPGAAREGLEVREYDGVTLPFDDRSYDVVLLSDVLHHCPDPAAVLAECLRVARMRVVLKDHLAFGALSRRILLWMDQAGNAAPGVHVEGNYLDLPGWISLVDQVGARITRLTWPVDVHAAPIRWVTRSEHQMVASIER